jgi:signal transduction histidine kinase
MEKAGADELLDADPAQLRQLLMNLVLNAADAAGPGGWVRIETEFFTQHANALPNEDGNGTADCRTLTPGGRGQVSEGDSPGRGEGNKNLTSSEHQHPSQIVLRVLDNGSGPPREMIDRLFEPFATSKPEGVGLGLAVARQIAQSHGGRIVFHRASGETCFEVHLPVRPLNCDDGLAQAHGLQSMGLDRATPLH